MPPHREKIIIPDKFPHILKTYFKDVMKTQPYDVLAWSASYFRSIAENGETPAKYRFEEISESNARSHSLTKGYLKVLVKQLGKGFFVERKLLQDKWKGLSLSENCLLVYLNVCGMYSWEQIHWLKLLALLAASICEDFSASIDLVCEILTEDLDDGENLIPFWMFEICYKFLANLDCGSDQQVKSDPLIKSPIQPETINARRFQQFVLFGWKMMIKKPDEFAQSEFTKVFHAIKIATNFEQVIQTLKNCQPIEGPDFEHLTNLEFHEKLIREIGAPWNWVYQFVKHSSSHIKSYNFCECSSDEDSKDVTIPIESFCCFVPQIPGVGSSLTSQTIESNLNELKAHMDDDGLINPKIIKTIH